MVLKIGVTKNHIEIFRKLGRVFQQQQKKSPNPELGLKNNLQDSLVKPIIFTAQVLKFVFKD